MLLAHNEHCASLLFKCNNSKNTNFNTWGSIRHSCSWPQTMKSRNRGRKCSLIAFLGFDFTLQVIAYEYRIILSDIERINKQFKITVLQSDQPILMKHQNVEPVRNITPFLNFRPHPLDSMWSL